MTGMMNKLITLVITFFLIGSTFTSGNLVKRDVGQAQQQQQLINSLSGHSMAKRPFCNAFTGCGKKRSVSIPNYPNLPSTINLDESSTSLSTDESLTTGDWLNYLRLTQKLMDEARSWEILQNRFINN